MVIGRDLPCDKTGDVDMGTSHFTRLTGQKTVRLNKENGTRLSDQAGPTKRNGS